MKKLMALIAVLLLAASCSQGGDPQFKEKETPGPNVADSVATPDDVTPWTADKCMVDSDCDTASVAACQTAECRQGECVVVDVVAGTPCESDGLTLEECQASVCKLVDGAMACVADIAPNGAPCGEFYAACGLSAGCYNGLCQDPCDDGNACTDGKCTAEGCTYVNNTAACSDGNACTVNDTCADGECVGEVVCECTDDEDCQYLDDGNPCTGQYICKNKSCVISAATVVECEETGFEPCQKNLCNPENGECEVTVEEDGFECDDGLACTDGDFCVAGECTGIGNITCEWLCDDTLDDDGDELIDCDDPDCWGDPDGICPEPECGDGTCQELAEEDCATCPEDCGECPPECGDGELQVEIDEECDDGNLDPGDGCNELCKVEPAVVDAGTIIVTEIMKDPNAVNDSEGEWVEIYNTTADDVDINAWTFKDQGTDSHRIFVMGGLVVPGNGFLVLGINGDTETNGGVAIDYVYDGFTLANGVDEVVLMAGETEIDVVVYDDGDTFPDEAGKSLSLDPDAMTAELNDAGANWCPAETPTPGAMNANCPECGDGTCNGDENCESCPDDCGCGDEAICVDGVCVALAGLGDSCGANEDCASDFCVDGVCCNVACNGVCEACDVAGLEGTCTPHADQTDPEGDCALCRVCNGNGSCVKVTAGMDPVNDCTQQPMTTCGFDGTCDGDGQCAYWDINTECKGATCNGQTFSDAVMCDGLGECPDAVNESCCPYKCGVDACLTECDGDNDCCGNASCVLNACVVIP